jgi:polygalacturonase
MPYLRNSPVHGAIAVLLAFGVSQAKSAERASSVFDVRQYGAAGDGKTLDTAAINKAIQACNGAGGGSVLFTPGEYVTGTFIMRSHVTLNLEAGAVIKGSTNLADYLPKSDFNARGFNGEGKRMGIMLGIQVEDVAITGRGVIDGRGTYFVNGPHSPIDYDPSLTREGADFMSVKSVPWDGPLKPIMPWDDRPGVLILFAGCKHVLLRDFTIHDAHNWTVHMNGAEDVVISGIRILNNVMIPNNDGLNLGGKNIRISDCYIETGDDGFAINGCENLTANNCTLISRSAAIRFAGGRYCTFQNIVIRDSNRGIGIFGSADHVLFSDILMQTRLFNGSWWGKAEPIYISAGRGGGRGGGAGTAAVNAVRFSNIVIEGEAGVLVNGSTLGSINDLTFDRVKVRLKGGPASPVVGGNFDLRAIGVPVSGAIVKHDIPALYFHNVEGLKIHGLEVDWADPLPDFFSEAIYCENFKDLTMDGFVGRQARPSVESAVVLKNGSKVSVRNCQAAPGTSTFLSLAGVTDLRSFVNNDLSDAKVAISPPESQFQQR